MVKKKIAIIFGIIALIAIISSGTITYFTAEGSATNVITSAKFSIDLIEKSKNSKGIEIPFEDVDRVMPGAECSKIVTVKNNGSVDLYARISVSNIIVLSDGTENDVTGSDDFVIDYNTEKWTEKDGYWYYNEPVKPGEESLPLFTTVGFSEGMGNEYQSGKLIVKVVVDSVQTRHNGTSALDAEFPKGGESK